MSIIRTSAPLVEPVTLAEAKAHLRVTHDDEDLQIRAMISTAREACEDRLQRSLITGGWRLTLPAFLPAIRLLKGPIQAVIAITYRDPDAVVQTLDASAYQFGKLNGMDVVMPAPGRAWPATMSGALDAVSVEYRAGYGDGAADVPFSIRAWILLAIGDLFERRGLIDVGGAVNTLPLPEHLLDTYSEQFV